MIFFLPEPMESTWYTSGAGQRFHKLLQCFSNTKRTAVVFGEYVQDCALSDVIRSERWETCRELLQSNDALRLVQHQDDESNGPLHTACAWHAPADIIKSIYNVDPQQAVRQNYVGSTPLHPSFWSASEDVLALLLNVAPQAAAVTDNGGWLSLHLAIRNRRSPSIIKKS